MILNVVSPLGGAITGLLGLAILVVVLTLYFIPTIVAHRTRHHFLLVFLINLFFGWSLLGWVIALVLAL